MAKYIYPAIFSEEGYMYNVSFPDLSGCNTFGNNLQEAFDMAEAALSLYLYECEENKIPIQKATRINDIQHKKNEIVSLVSCDTIVYRERFDCTLVKKTVTIESWLNKMAENANLNFSQLLRKAIKNELNL